MKTALIYTSGNTNCYLTSAEKKMTTLLHPLLQYFIENGSDYKEDGKILPTKIAINGIEYSEQQILYYFKKFLFWEEKGITPKDKPKIELDGITANEVKVLLANVDHVSFEVTDGCNLQCRYCAYGELYDNYDTRNNIPMMFGQAKKVIDYLYRLWESPQNKSQKPIRIGFYGGEPLLNMSLIKQVVDYMEGKSFSNNTINYGMTTNGMLLDRYMDYLVEKKFTLLISLDGNEKNNSYRVKKDNAASFPKVYQNIKILQTKHPDYFQKHVSFNAVLHNRNSVEEIVEYIDKEFGKIPEISEVNTNGMSPEKQQEFYQTYKNFKESIHQSEHYDDVSQALGFNDYITLGASYFVFLYTDHMPRTYSDFYAKGPIRCRPTGTCSPFSKKIFITVNGKILPCERIGQKYPLGQVTNDGIELNPQKVSDIYNNYYNKLKEQCSNCYIVDRCNQCLFYLEDIDTNPRCKGRTDGEALKKYLSYQMTVLENDPTLYETIIKKLTLMF